jgi:hypothetical protein
VTQDSESPTSGTGNTAGFVYNVDVDPQKLGHFGADDPVAGICSTAGRPYYDIGDVSFRKPFGVSAGCNRQKYYQTKN